MTISGQTILIMSVTAAAASDLCAGKVYNFLVLPALAGGILIAGLEVPHSIPVILLAVLLTHLLLFPFWKAGGIGAGDIKLFSSIIPFLGVSWYLTCFVLSFIIAALVSIVVLLIYRDFSRRIHLAVPIGISVMLCLLLWQLGIQSPIQI